MTGSGVPKSKPSSHLHASRHVLAEDLGSGTAAHPHLEIPERGQCSGATGHTKREIDADYPCLKSFFEEHSFTQRFQPDSTILLHGEPADAIFRVSSGTVRCCTIDPDGTRQIFAFARDGEFVGLSDVEQWHYTAEAVDFVILKAVPRITIEQALAVNIPLRQEYRRYLAALLQQREHLLLFLTHSRATQRLFQFLCEFASSRQTSGYVSLPMSRRDIADHLGLSVETVSRSFSDLKNHSYIDLANTGKFMIRKGLNGSEISGMVTSRKSAAAGLLASPTNGLAPLPVWASSAVEKMN